VVVLDKEEMNSRVNEILSLVPRGPKGSPQNEFRVFLNRHARRVWSKNPSAPVKRILMEAIEWAKKEHPNFVPSYDPELFFH